MTLLILFTLVALVFSFLCSIAEAVLLSITPAYVALAEQEERSFAQRLGILKTDIQRPLAAILTLNTIAHTVGAAGAGAQAAAVFGSAYLGVASAILTLLILVLSEIIPKTLGAKYWQRLVPVTTWGLWYLVKALLPFVWLSEFITGGMKDGPTLSGFGREEFSAMAEISAREGSLGRRESRILQNVLAAGQTPVEAAMTPRTVIFSQAEATTLRDYFKSQGEKRFSRIPVYASEPDDITGFVLRGDLVQSQAEGATEVQLAQFRRDLPVIPPALSLTRAFQVMQDEKVHMALVVDEYGSLQGLLTLEDILETLLGTEIVDESDTEVDMQEVARRRWRRRAQGMGLDTESKDPSEKPQ
jgi:CBS domain containing-hemolysin-like protein